MLPEYLRKGALETLSVGMIKDLIKSVLNDTFDDETEDEMLNKMITSSRKVIIKRPSRATTIAPKSKKWATSIPEETPEEFLERHKGKNVDNPNENTEVEIKMGIFNSPASKRLNAR